MVFDVKTQALANLAVQLLLILIVFGSAYLAKKRDLNRHCMVMRASVILQIIAVAIVMLPSMLGYIENENPGAFFNTEMLIHHTLGLAVIALWIYINLVFLGIVKITGRLVTTMRLAFAFWVLSLLIGLHMYVLIWVLK